MIKNIKEILNEVAMENHRDRPDNRRLSTGFTQLDGIIGLNNLNSGYFICLASRPGKGKSTFMLDLLLNLLLVQVVKYCILQMKKPKSILYFHTNTSIYTEIIVFYVG